MDSTKQDGYKPLTEFKEIREDPLIDIELSDSTELWLIQCPKDSSLLDLNGQEATLKLHHDKKNMGSFVGSTGKSYDMVNSPSLNNDLSVFLPSCPGSKFVGKISRVVSLVHYPEPSEIEDDKKRKVELKAKRAVESLSRPSPTPSKSGTRTIGHRSSSSKHNSSRSKSSRSGLTFSGSGSGSKTPKRRPVGEESKRDPSGSDSGKKVKTEG